MHLYVHKFCGSMELKGNGVDAVHLIELFLLYNNKKVEAWKLLTAPDQDETP